MTEGDSREWIRAQFGDVAAKKLERFYHILQAESSRQNLIAPSTAGSVWSRHFVDSAQLIMLGPAVSGRWVDVGSGAGFPGIVVAICSNWAVDLVESRRLRAEFLSRCVAELGLNASVHLSRIEGVRGTLAAVISARAVAPLSRLIGSSIHLADSATCWLLPKGASAAKEVAETRQAWHGTFHVKPSVVDPMSGIVVASNVAPR